MNTPLNTVESQNTDDDTSLDRKARGMTSYDAVSMVTDESIADAVAGMVGVKVERCFL